MSSTIEPKRPTLCRNQLTRSPWTVVSMLLLASPLTRSLALGGTLALGTGCEAPTQDECEQWYEECVLACEGEDRGPCLSQCRVEREQCYEDIARAAEQREIAVDVVSTLAMSCGSISCDSDDDDDWDDPAPAPEPDPAPPPPPSPDDWGEDWGELEPDDEPSIDDPAWSDIPHDESSTW